MLAIQIHQRQPKSASFKRKGESSELLRKKKAEVSKIYTKNKSSISEILKKEKEMHARLTFSLQTVKDTATMHDKSLLI